MAELSSDRVKKGLRFFLLITIPTLLIILLLTVREETWEALKGVSPFFLLLTTTITLLRFYIESLRIQILSWAGGKWIHLKDSLDFNLGSLFLGAVTPFQSGGIVLQLYILNHAGLSIGRGTNVLFIKGILPTFIFLLSLPFIFVYNRTLFETPLIRSLVKYIFSLYGILIILLFFFFIKPSWVERGLLRFESFLRRKGILKGDRGLRVLEKGFHQMNEFGKGLKESMNLGRMKILLAFLLSLVGLLLHAITAPLLLLGLGVEPHFLTSMALQVLLYFLLVFSPTPGASGIAEVATYKLFDSLCPRPLLGIFVILLRFFYLYLAAALGGILLLQRVKSRELQWNETTKRRDPSFSTSSHSRNSGGR